MPLASAAATAASIPLSITLYFSLPPSHSALLVSLAMPNWSCSASSSSCWVSSNLPASFLKLVRFSKESPAEALLILVTYWLYMSEFLSDSMPSNSARDAVFWAASSSAARACAFSAELYSWSFIVCMAADSPAEPPHVTFAPVTIASMSSGVNAYPG